MSSAKLLTAEDLRSLLAYCPRSGVFTWRSSNGRAKKGSAAGALGANGRVYIGIRGRLYLAHRLAWLYMHGQLPFQTIDHIDGDPANNRLSNLRAVSQQVNNQNISRNPCHRRVQTGISRGVWMTESGSYRAQISIDGKTFYLGRFASEEEAANAYKAARMSFHPGAVEGRQ